MSSARDASADYRRVWNRFGLGRERAVISLYHMGLYDEKLLAWLEREWPKHTDAKLDLGKCCLRFRKVDQVPYELIGKLAKKMTVRQWIKACQTARQ